MVAKEVEQPCHEAARGDVIGIDAVGPQTGLHCTRDPQLVGKGRQDVRPAVRFDSGVDFGGSFFEGSVERVVRKGREAEDVDAGRAGRKRPWLGQSSTADGELRRPASATTSVR